MSKWTDEPGVFSVGTDKGWDYGTWRQAGLSGGGYASAQVWRYHDGSGLVGVHTCANLTPEQARQLAQVLSDAADKAEAESAEGVAP
jgi:hypothetical protein